MKLQEREFFSFSAPDIANAVSAAKRRELIAALDAAIPTLFARYQQAKEAADRTLAYVRSSGQYPLTGRGDINTYMLFAELARKTRRPRRPRRSARRRPASPPTTRPRSSSPI